MERPAARQRHEPARTCVACRKPATKQELVRVVRGADGGVALDRTGRAPGRGAYVHPDRACLEAARKRHALERALGAPIGVAVWAELGA